MITPLVSDRPVTVKLVPILAEAPVPPRLTVNVERFCAPDVKLIVPRFPPAVPPKVKSEVVLPVKVPLPLIVPLSVSVNAPIVKLPVVKVSAPAIVVAPVIVAL